MCPSCHFFFLVPNGICIFHKFDIAGTRLVRRWLCNNGQSASFILKVKAADIETILKINAVLFRDWFQTFKKNNNNEI